MLRKTLKVLAWVVGGLAGLCVAPYLVVVAINWRDVEPSAQAIRTADSYRDRPAVRDEDNAFIFVMGFEVAPSESPYAMGLKRLVWLRQYEGPAQLDRSTDPLGDPPSHRLTMHPALRTYFESCALGTAGCAAALVAADQTFDEWAASEDWLLERYRSFLELPGWREEIPTDVAAPLPAYQVVMDGQKVLLLHARNRAALGDAPGVTELLGADIRFWRRVLASSDGLLSKMIVTAAIKRHFKLGAEAIALLPPERMSGALPPEWLVEVSEAELSLRRVMIGEWVYMGGVVNDLSARDLAGEFIDGGSLLDKAKWLLSEPLFQPQDTINLNTEQYLGVAELLESMPLVDYEDVANRLTELSAQTVQAAISRWSVYNFVGRLQLGMGVVDFGRYAHRLGDIEGVRRAALAAISLRVAKVSPNDTPSALAASSLRNPYDGEPFAWDAADGAVIFRGLEPGERGEHRVR